MRQFEIAYAKSDLVQIGAAKKADEKHIVRKGGGRLFEFVHNSPSDTNPCHEHIDSMPMRTGNPTPMLPKSGVDASTIRMDRVSQWWPGMVWAKSRSAEEYARIPKGA